MAIATLANPNPRDGKMSQEQIQIVKSTAPILAEHGIALTTAFYKNMLRDNKDLNNVFNSANQYVYISTS